MSATLIWSALRSRLAGSVATVLAAVLVCFLAAALVGHAGQKARADRLSKERDAWKTTAARWEASARSLHSAFDEAEALRIRETAQARAAASEFDRACSARVAAARRSARAIETIVNQEVARDANGCPARGLVPRERLRDALAPAS